MDIHHRNTGTVSFENFRELAVKIFLGIDLADHSPVSGYEILGREKVDRILLALIAGIIESGKLSVRCIVYLQAAQYIVIVPYSFLFYSFFPLVGIGVIVSDTEHFKTFVVILVVDLSDMGKSGTARAAPCGPEIDQNHIAFKVTELYLFPVGIFTNEIGSGLARL